MSDAVCPYCGRRGDDICDEPPNDICERAVEASLKDDVTEPSIEQGVSDGR